MGLLSWASRIFAGGGAILFALGLALYHFQEKLLYVPSLPDMPREYTEDPSVFDLPFEDVEVETEGVADGPLTLHAWFIKVPEAMQAPPSQGSKRPVLLFLQENAGNISQRLPNLRLLIRQLRCPILVLSYRGYGASPGKPSEPGLREDARAALRYLAHTRPQELYQRDSVSLEYDTDCIAVFGRSLGGAVALHLAADAFAAARAKPAPARSQVAAVIVENTFSAIEDMVRSVPFLTMLAPLLGAGGIANRLIRNPWMNKAVITRIGPDTPLMLMSSLLDEVVPASQMRDLREIAEATGAASVTWVEFSESHHMDAYMQEAPQYWTALTQFWRERVLPAR